MSTTTGVSTLAPARRLAATVPAWVWVSGMVVVSTVVRTALAKRHPAPWIFDDELIYQSLASSFGTTGHFAIRGTQGLLGYGPGYPLLIAPAYAVFHDFAQAYTAAKGINSLLMSLAAFPAYYLARRVVSQPLALLAAVFALALPSLEYTGTIMTENAFYPAFMFCALAFVWALEKPTAARQLIALATIVPAFLIRAQAALLLASLVTAILVLVLVEAHAAGDELSRRRLLRRLDAFRATGLAILGAAVLLVAVELARGRSLGDVLGAYQDVTSWDYTVGGVVRWFVYQLGELDLYLGFIPFAALIVVTAVAFVRSESSHALRVFVAVSVPLVVWITLAAAAFSSQLAETNGGIGRIEERNAFYVAPLFLIAMLVWVERGLPRRWPVAGLAAVVAVALPGMLPLERLANLSALSDTLAFIPLARRVSHGDLAPSDMLLVVMTLATIGAAVFILLPRRLALLAPALVLAYLITWQVSVENQMRGTSLFLLQGSLTGRREWVDDHVHGRGTVAAIWSAGGNPFTIPQTEFFNKSIGRVYSVDGAQLGEQIPEQAVSIGPSGRVLLAGSGASVHEPYVLVDGSLEPVGRAVASDSTVGIGATLYRVKSPLSLKASISGRYADGSSGPRLAYTRYHCPGGRLIATFENFPGLVKVPQHVRAAGGAGVTAVLLGPRAARRTLSVPLRSRDGRCRARFTITPTGSPAEALGKPDTRILGVHFSALTYEPPRAKQS